MLAPIWRLTAAPRQLVGQERPLGVDDDEVIDQALLELNLREAETFWGALSPARWRRAWPSRRWGAAGGALAAGPSRTLWPAAASITRSGLAGQSSARVASAHVVSRRATDSLPGPPLAIAHSVRRTWVSCRLAEGFFFLPEMDRTSCAKFRPNQFRVLLALAALSCFRSCGGGPGRRGGRPPGHHLARAAAQARGLGRAVRAPHRPAPAGLAGAWR